MTMISSAGALAAMCSAADTNRFEELYYKYRLLMYHAAYEILKNPQDSEDAVQEAFFNIARNFEKICEVNSPQTRSFAVIITRNVCFNMLRKKRGVSDIDEEDIPSERSAEDMVFSDYGVEVLTNALERLPQKYRDFLHLTVYEEMSLHEAAEFLGITYENAKSRAKRARKRLAEILKEEGYE